MQTPLPRLGFVVVIASCAASLLAQTPEPSFEVASIKRNTSNESGGSFGPRPGGRFILVNTVIANLIRPAYPSDSVELIGAPGWVLSDAYDVNAKAPEANVTPAAMEGMLRSLLAERFKLKAHYEMQERPVYALVVARNDGRLGPQLQRSTLDCEAINQARRAGKPVNVSPPANGAPPCAMRGNGEMWAFGGMPLQRLAQTISSAAGRVVIDKTGLQGNFELTLNFDTRPDTDQPSIFVAVEEQLGLKLQPDRAPLKVLVIDHIERPTPD